MDGDARTDRKPLSCRLGLHAFVRAHSDDERLRGPDHQVCRRCGKRRQHVTGFVPPAGLT
jgi:hypothetical protein